MSQTPRDKTEAKLYDALVSFNTTAQWDILRLAQMRQYLAEHLANALVPSWLHERKAQTAAEEIAHVLLMVGLMPSDWVDAHRAEVLNQEADNLLRHLGTSGDDASGEAHDAVIAWAAGALRLRAEAGEEATAAAATATPTFFQPEHRYAHGPWHFHCATVTAHPETGEQSALGWLRINNSPWTTYAYNAAEWGADWTDVTEAGGPDA